MYIYIHISNTMLAQLSTQHRRSSIAPQSMLQLQAMGDLPQQRSGAVLVGEIVDAVETGACGSSG